MSVLIRISIKFMSIAKMRVNNKILWNPIRKDFFFITFFSKCTALQKRPLDCVMSNGTVLDPMLCNERDKPTQKRECFNENCRGTWKVSEWSHVSPLLPTFFFILPSVIIHLTATVVFESTNYLVIFFSGDCFHFLFSPPFTFINTHALF